MALSKLSPELPLEIFCEIIKFLPLTHLQTISLTSRLIRSQAIHFIFGHLRYTGDLPLKVHKIHQARKDVKAVIKKLELYSDHVEIGSNEPLIIFQFLETLPNLQVLDVGELFIPSYLSEFISSIRHAALLELDLETSFSGVDGPPTAGLAGLEKLSIAWYADDSLIEPGSSLAHLYEFIRPTLTTLVELRMIVIAAAYGSIGDFDLQLLKPAADALRTFEYTLQSADESILDTIPTILPHLSKLSIRWDNYYAMYSVLWKDAHIQALSKNENLTDLELSSDFEPEVNAQDNLKVENDYARYVRSYKRRLKATQDIASACPRLQRCSWVQMDTGRNSWVQISTDYNSSNSMSHPFIVWERMTHGNVTRVVRGIKQDWMGRDHETEEGIVKCKPEDLPGDIIGQNDVE